MIGLVVAIVVVSVLLTVAVYLLGFRLGGAGAHHELMRVRMEAAQAERRLHELTRQAFTAMAETVERRRPH